MKFRLERTAEKILLAITALVGLAQTCWAGPPMPPGLGATPSVPVGGPEVTIATTLVIAGYGIWRSRK